MDAKFYEKHGVAPPASTGHGATADDIASKLAPLKAKEWRQEGNYLIAVTDVGEFGQPIPTNLVLKGTDGSGLPILEKLDIK